MCYEYCPGCDRGFEIGRRNDPRILLVREPISSLDVLGNVRDARHQHAEIQLDRGVFLQRPRYQHCPTDSVTRACDVLPALAQLAIELHSGLLESTEGIRHLLTPATPSTDS